MSSAAGMPGAIAVRSCGVQRAAVYKRRRPERTAGYQAVPQNLETWQLPSGWGESYGLPMPAYRSWPISAC